MELPRMTNASRHINRACRMGMPECINARLVAARCDDAVAGAADSWAGGQAAGP